MGDVTPGTADPGAPTQRAKCCVTLAVCRPGVWVELWVGWRGVLLVAPGASTDRISALAPETPDRRGDVAKFFRPVRSDPARAPANIIPNRRRLLGYLQ